MLIKITYVLIGYKRAPSDFASWKGSRINLPYVLHASLELHFLSLHMLRVEYR